MRGERSEGDVPSRLWKTRCVGGRIEVSPTHDDFPALLAEAMDTLAAADFDPKPAAGALGCSVSQLVKLLKKEPRALRKSTASASALGCTRFNNKPRGEQTISLFPPFLSHARSSACFRSAIRSSLFSMPQAMRIMLSGMPDGDALLGREIVVAHHHRLLDERLDAAEARSDPRESAPRRPPRPSAGRRRL